MLTQLATETGAPIHVAHLSDADSLGKVRTARAAGKRITAETCTHYLVFAAEEIPDGDTLYKCAPPIREKENRDRLWKVRRGPSRIPYRSLSTSSSGRVACLSPLFFSLDPFNKRVSTR
jgi:hypothetical protein